MILTSGRQPGNAIRCDIIAPEEEGEIPYMKTKRLRGSLAVTASLAAVLISLMISLAGCGKEGKLETGGGSAPSEGGPGPQVINFWQPG